MLKEYLRGKERMLNRCVKVKENADKMATRITEDFAKETAEKISKAKEHELIEFLTSDDINLVEKMFIVSVWLDKNESNKSFNYYNDTFKPNFSEADLEKLISPDFPDFFKNL